MKTKMNNPWLVAKFGGTSVKDRKCWDNIKTIIDRHLQQNKKVFVVCSAPGEVSNDLESLVNLSLQKNHQEKFDHIKLSYQTLATDLGVSFASVKDAFMELQQLCAGIALLGEASHRVRAKIMAFGELMLTRLGYQYLKRQKLAIVWQDARDIMKISVENNHNSQTNYLNAICDAEYDEKLAKSLNKLKESVVITQGFIASNSAGETVLLGKGGSDISCACFAAKLAANTCEIWTDVPGIYTANPHLIPEAKLLKQLDYAEAQEIASLGAEVLHPNCVPPLRENKIPLYIKYTQEPQIDGTLVSFDSSEDSILIKSIIMQYGVLLISIESIQMWKRVGFLADVFACFKKHGVSVNLISTSESNVTVSLDSLDIGVGASSTNAVDDDYSSKAVVESKALESLLTDLNKVAIAKVIGPCASISLVGRHIRAMLHQISDLFDVFASQKIHLLSQAANDLNLTFVVDSEQAQRLAKKLHVILIEYNPKSFFIGKSWLEEYGDIIKTETPWWQRNREELLTLAVQKGPVYIYSQSELEKSASQLLSCKNVNKIFYAMKANSHPDILRVFYRKGLNFECVSLGEVNRLLDLFPDILPSQILFTPNFAPKHEYETAIKLNIQLTVDSLFPFQHWPKLFSHQSIFIRIDPGYGGGHHKYVCTGGTESKFGIPLAELPEVAAIAKKYHIHITGLHTHSGSGILQSDSWQETAKLLSQQLELFPKVKIINVGGGLGVVERPGQKPLDLRLINEAFGTFKKAYSNLSLWIEPGRYLVATAGVLLAKVTQVKQKGNIVFVGIETGMNSLIRPALYGSYHEIINLSKFEQPKSMLANIVGPICESGDTLGYSRLLPMTEESDVILFATAGAYGYSMSSHYNLRQPASEYYFKN